MVNYQAHDDYKLLSKSVYKNNLGKYINGWKCVENQHGKYGFYG